MNRLLAVMAVAALAGAPSLGRANELDIGRASSVGAMDPGFLREPATVVDNVFDTLVGRDAAMRLVPGLALSWTALDPTTWEFRLRPGVSFHNGEPFTAEAVKFSLDRVLDPAAHAPTLSYISTVAGVDVVDGLTVRIRTEGPDALLPTRMSRYPAYIVPPGYVARVGSAAFARQPVGTGAYRVTEFVPDDHVTLEANAGYWRGKPAIDRVVWRTIPEATARVAALMAGEVQLIEGVPVELAPALAADPDLDLVQAKGGLTVYLGLKMADKPLDDPRVRQALSLAIDRPTIVAGLLQGFATPSGTQAGPFDFGYKAEPVPPYDPARARALLAEAGYPNGFSIRMQVPRHYANSAELGQVIAQEFAAIGVNAALDVPEWSVYSQQVPAGQQAPIYNLAWGSTQTLDADASLYPILHSGQPYSTAAMPAMDKLLDEARATLDPAQRAAAFARAQDLAASAVPLLTLYQEDAIYGKRKAVTFTGRPDARISLFDMRIAD